MSIHPSLKSSKTKPRSVLKRFERLQKALKDGKRKEGDSVFGLPKYNPPTSCDVRHIIDAIEQGDYINDAEPYIHKELWGILKNEL